MAADRSRKLRVGVLFGGRSAEHEVSLASAAGIMASLDGARGEIVPLLVTREGRWLLLPRPDAPEEEGRAVYRPAAPGGGALRFPEGGEATAVDVFFP
ncbi:MAG: D-alanine--D-alanine ligase A, partial [bacterium]